MFTKIVFEQMLVNQLKTIPIIKTIKPTPSPQVPFYPYRHLNAKAKNVPSSLSFSLPPPCLAMLTHSPC